MQGLSEKKCYIGEEEADETDDSDNDGENTFFIIKHYF